MYSLLKQQQRTNKIPAALPEGVSVANKTGELSDVENDAGILYNAQGGNDLVIVFLSQNLSSPGEAQNTMHSLAAVFISTIMINLNSYDTSVKRSKSCSCLHDKAFELGTRQI